MAHTVIIHNENSLGGSSTAGGYPSSMPPGYGNITGKNTGLFGYGSAAQWNIGLGLAGLGLQLYALPTQLKNLKCQNKLIDKQIAALNASMAADASYRANANCMNDLSYTCANDTCVS